MNISKKLFIGFALVTSLAIIVGSIGIAGMQRLHRTDNAMYEKQVIGLQCLGKASAAFKDVRLSLHQVLINGFYNDLKGAKNANGRFYANIKEFEYWMDAFYQVADTDELNRFHDRIMELFIDEYVAGAEEIIALSINDIPDHIYKLKQNVMHASLKMSAERIDILIDGIFELEGALAAKANHNNAHFTELMIQVQCLFLIVAVLIAVIVTAYVTINITKPVNEAADVLHKITKGDFEARVMGEYTGEFALIKDSVNETAKGIKQYIGDKLHAERAAYESKLAMERSEAAKEAILDSINYASRIQKNLLSKEDVFQRAFSDYSIIWSPRDIVGGDIYWLKNFDEGSLLCVCDCTGHGTPGALLTMLAVSAFEATVTDGNYQDTAQLIWALEQKLVNVLNVNAPILKSNQISQIRDGCDIAVLYIGKDGNVSISAGNMHVFICDGNDVTQIKGQRLFVGEGNLKSKEDVRIVKIPANREQKFYIASDGLYDQIGGQHARPFGYTTFKKLILEHHTESQTVISERVWDAFESYRGEHSRRDDMELITFKP